MGAEGAQALHGGYRRGLLCPRAPGAPVEAGTVALDGTNQAGARAAGQRFPWLGGRGWAPGACGEVSELSWGSSLDRAPSSCPQPGQHVAQVRLLPQVSLQWPRVRPLGSTALPASPPPSGARSAIHVFCAEACACGHRQSEHAAGCRHPTAGRPPKRPAHREHGQEGSMRLPHSGAASKRPWPKQQVQRQQWQQERGQLSPWDGSTWPSPRPLPWQAGPGPVLSTR